MNNEVILIDKEVEDKDDDSKEEEHEEFCYSAAFASLGWIAGGLG